MSNERHAVSIPHEVLEQLKVKTREINQLLAPYALALTPQERHDLPKMGEKTVSFVEKAFEFAAENVDLRPVFLDMTAFEVDMNDAKGLRVIENNARQALETVGDVEMAAGSEAFHSALAFYNYVKMLAAQDVPRAKAIYDELKARFPSVGRKRKSAGE
jgi:hypothetical protein